MVNVDFTMKRLEYLHEEKRLQSFIKWPFKDNCKCSKLKMAEAGFFWIGSKSEPDIVQCFICNKELDGWESNDDPWEEHQKHSKDCLFVKLGKPEKQLTLYQFFDVYEAMLTNMVETKANETEKKYITKYNESIELIENILNINE